MNLVWCDYGGNKKLPRAFIWVISLHNFENTMQFVTVTQHFYITMLVYLMTRSSFASAKLTTVPFIYFHTISQREANGFLLPLQMQTFLECKHLMTSILSDIKTLQNPLTFWYATVNFNEMQIFQLLVIPLETKWHTTQNQNNRHASDKLLMKFTCGDS